jgi:hypothetical protein
MSGADHGNLAVIREMQGTPVAELKAARDRSSAALWHYRVPCLPARSAIGNLRAKLIFCISI